jgi:hypothetical protein
MTTTLERGEMSRVVGLLGRHVQRNAAAVAGRRPPDRGCPERKPEDVGRMVPEVKIASRLDEFRSAFALVYDAYTRAGLATANPCGMRVTPYQLLPTTEVLLATDQNRVVCTASLVRDGLLGLPLEDLYAEEVADRRRQGRIPAEVSCLADCQNGTRTAFSNVLQLMSLCVQCARARGVDELLIAVHPHHARFYQGFFGFTLLGEQRSYRAVLNAPAVALELDLLHLAERHPRGYERLFGKPLPAEVLAYRPMPDGVRRELALHMSDMAASNECICHHEKHQNDGVVSVCSLCGGR